MLKNKHRPGRTICAVYISNISVPGLYPVDIVMLFYMYVSDLLIGYPTVTLAFLEFFLAAVFFVETVLAEEISYNCKLYSTADVIE